MPLQDLSGESCIRVRSKTIKPLSEGHIYDVLNMSLVVPWRRTL